MSLSLRTSATTEMSTNIKPRSHHRHQVHGSIMKTVLHEGIAEKDGLSGDVAGYSHALSVLIVL